MKKICKTCGASKTAEHFYISRVHAGGRRPHCKACMKIAYRANPQPTRDRASAWYADNREIAMARNKLRHKANRSQRLAARRAARNDRVRANEKAWRLNNRDKIRTNDAYQRSKRRAAKRSGPHEHIDPTEIGRRDQWRCHLCGRRVRRADFTLDHLIPLSKGGTHTRDNVATAHRRCNSSKGNRFSTHKSLSAPSIPSARLHPETSPRSGSAAAMA